MTPQRSVRAWAQHRTMSCSRSAASQGGLWTRKAGHSQGSLKWGKVHIFTFFFIVLLRQCHYRFWKFNSVDFRADSVALGAKLPFAVHATNMRVFGWKIALSSSFTVPFEYYFKKKCPVSEVSMWCVQKEMEMHLELIKRHLAVHVLSQCYVLGFLNDWFLRGLKFLRKNFYEACFKMHPILTQNRQCFPLRCLANNPHVHALLFM